MVSKVKFKKYDELNEKLETKEDKKEVYRLAEVRGKQPKDFQYV